MSDSVKIIAGDLENPHHCEALGSLLNEYIEDRMGGGKPLDRKKQRKLFHGLKNHPGSHVFFAKKGDAYVGLCTCFLAFSTFDARSILNVHDLIVSPASRQKGIGTRLLKAVEAKAKKLKCSKLTLEVRIDNSRARYLYRKRGFNECSHPMDFWIKRL